MHAMHVNDHNLTMVIQYTYHETDVHETLYVNSPTYKKNIVVDVGALASKKTSNLRDRFKAPQLCLYCK